MSSKSRFISKPGDFRILSKDEPTPDLAPPLRQKPSGVVQQRDVEGVLIKMAVYDLTYRQAVRELTSDRSIE